MTMNELPARCRVDGSRLRDQRDKLDWTNAEFAEHMNLKVGSLVNILSGSDPASRRVIYRFSRVLDLPVEEIIGATYPDEPPKQPDRPKSPKRRQDTEQTKGPKRAQGRAA
jgi:transcriptional regulator with XRE-family HTH domain